MKDTAIAFGKRVRCLRKERQLSQEKLAELCELHPTYIGQMERGEKNPTVETIFQICRGLNISPDQLFRNLSAEDEQTLPQKAYNLFLNYSPDDQQILLDILEKAASLIK